MQTPAFSLMFIDFFRRKVLITQIENPSKQTSIVMFPGSVPLERIPLFLPTRLAGCGKNAGR